MEPVYMKIKMCNIENLKMIIGPSSAIIDLSKVPSYFIDELKERISSPSANCHLIWKLKLLLSSLLRVKGEDNFDLYKMLPSTDARLANGQSVTDHMGRPSR